jgi:TonB family protein
MNRLQQKCFVASTGIHLLLLVILVVGPAFLTSRSKVDNTQILDIIPTRLIDAAFAGGGNPNGTPPPPAPPEPRPPTPAPPKPPPEPVKMRAPEPPPEPVKPTQPDPNALEPNPDRKRKLPDVPTTAVVRKPDKGKAPKPPTTSLSEDSEAKQIADRNRRIAEMLGATARSLRKDIAPGTTIEALGPGGGGEVYASYDQVVQSVYWHAWTPPEDTASDAAITKATVTIASDGTVLSARIIKPSGDAAVDRSVQQTLERVTFVARFPDSAKDKQRVYTIKFDLKAKRLS